METKIERIDEIPVLLHWLKQMRVEEIIDSNWKPHGNWKGLAYGQPAVASSIWKLGKLSFAGKSISAEAVPKPMVPE